MKKRKRIKRSGEKSPGYPYYPATEDIYVNEDRLQDINPDDGSKLEDDNQENGLNEKDYTNTQTGDDLDVPGSETYEEIGIEDEENNYFS